MTKDVTKDVAICERGECGGDCYRCRVQRLVESEAAANEAMRQLRDAVAEMRHAQREYFRRRSVTALHNAKTAEAEVDRLLGEFGNPTKPLF